MKFAYSKLSAAMLMALGLTACGGGGGDSGSGGDNPTVTTKVTQNIYYDIGEDSVVTQSVVASATDAKVKVCLDINGNNKCDLGEYTSSDKLSGIATLTFTEDEFANKKILVVQESKGISYEVDANLASKDSDGNRKSLYVNAITNLGSVLGQEKATQILGESAKLLLDPTIAPADTEVAQVLQEAIEQLGLTNNAEISNKVFTVESKLLNAYSHISSALDNGNDKEDILGHIRNNGTVENLPSLEPPIGNNKPVAKFEVSSNDAGRVTFKNLSTDADGDKLSYDWNFGDGSTSKETDPSHTYTKNGNYEVLLHVNDGKNFTTFRFTLTVTGVIDNNHAPTVSFSTVKTGLTVQFKNASTDADGDTLEYVWDFGDGSTSSVKNPVHTYTKAGSYSVILKVTDGKSDAKELTQTITVADVEVANKAPVADFDYQASQLAVTFTNKSSDADGDKLTYAWDFGDGTSSTEQSPKHTYTKDGIYKVVLTVSDGKDTKAKTTTIEVSETENVNHAPKAQSTAVVSGNKVTFTNTSTDVDGDELSYVWDFGDGFTSEDKVPAPHTYALDGEYTITLTVSDGKLKDENKHEVKIGKVVPPDVNLKVANVTATAENKGLVNFNADVTYSGSAALSYSWNFGDGKTSTKKAPAHTFTQNGTYNVTLTVKDANGVSNSNSVSVVVSSLATDAKPCDGQDSEFCYGNIDGGCSKEECKEVEKEVCTVEGNGGKGLPSIETQYYSTNPKGGVGVAKTISSMSDWTTDMIVAQGAANDDPRAYRGYHEKATDLYALYAAWDDTNLYLMVELPNLENRETCSDFDFSCDKDLFMGIGIRTGKHPVGDGAAENGVGVWTKTPFYQIKDGIDTLLMFHPNLKAGEPGLFKTNSEGLFSYDRENGYLFGFAEAGIERVVEEGHISSSFFGIPDNYLGGKDNYLTGSYENLLKGQANAHLYQITIPLASIDIDKAYLEKNGIGVVAFSSFGESLMDALPWSPVLVDKAAEAYSKDESSSAEKEDFDVYDVRLASVGKLTNGAGELVCNTVIEKQCETVELPEDQCPAKPKLALHVEHKESSEPRYVKSEITLATGFTGVKYTIEADGKTYILGEKELSKTLTFAKGDAERTVTVKVSVANAKGTKTDSKSFTVVVDACVGDECKVVENQWASATGDKASKIFVDDGTESACKLPAGSVAIKADVAEAPTVYAYTKDEATITAKWPGDTTKKIEDCTSAFWELSGLKDSDLYIVSNAGGKRYPAENKPGVTFSSETPCFDFASKKALSAEECGISSEVGADKVYAQRGTSKLEDGSVITISAKDDAPQSEYVDLGFMLYGKGVKADTTGSYVIDGEEYPFTNGDIIRVGEKVTAADTAAGEEPAQIKITLKYNDVSVNYTVKKVKWQKPVAKNDFSWNNILVYFVMTDRFENGDTSNDHSYGRPYKDSAGTAGATFHGGDIVGMTKRLDYIKSLGMNAIWITAPYEQSHGWTGGGSSGSFAHYAYHGYYALDFTTLDANIGTVDEFRTFVTEAHKRGIRVVLDIVMNHSGYATLKDMCDFGFGVRSDGKSACEEWTPGAGQSFHNKPIGESQDPKWDAWWGKSWIISGGYGEQCGCGDGLDACISFLPDFKNSDPTGPQVSIPAFLSKKWSSPDADHDIPAAMKYRSGSMSVAQFQARWLASWVEEFGIDGFRCDTAKHVAKPSWKLLKEYSNEALNKWREANKGGADPAAEWKDNFWMTGEHWGYKTDPSDGGGYASSGGFDSMINFSFNGQAKGGSCGTPSINSWKEYAGMYGVGSGSPKLNALTYVSSHDTSLCRPGNMKDLGTYLELLPGGVQVYYGDETARKNDNGGASNDIEHGTRSDMNFPSDISSQAEWAANVDTLSTKFSSDATLAHWQKVGQFRFRNVAVGAGKQEEIDSNTFCRTYKDEGTGIDNAVVIHVGADSTVNVGACFDDNTELQDAYSGATVTVSGGQVTIPAPGELVLLELKRN